MCVSDPSPEVLLQPATAPTEGEETECDLWGEDSHQQTVWGTEAAALWPRPPSATDLWDNTGRNAREVRIDVRQTHLPCHDLVTPDSFIL